MDFETTDSLLFLLMIEPKSSLNTVKKENLFYLFLNAKY